LVTVCLGFQVFAAVVEGNNHPNTFAANADEEAPFPAFNAGYGVRLGELPLFSTIEPSDIPDTLVSVLSVRLVNTFNLICFWHLFPSDSAERAKDRVFCCFGANFEVQKELLDSIPLEAASV
jgi:hypothetical protein